MYFILHAVAVFMCKPKHCHTQMLNVDHMTCHKILYIYQTRKTISDSKNNVFSFKLVISTPLCCLSHTNDIHYLIKYSQSETQTHILYVEPKIDCFLNM